MKPGSVARHLVACGLLVAGCGGGEPAVEAAPEDDARASALAALAAAPCDGATIAVVADSVLAPLLTGVGHVENEVMDCQRLVLGSGAEATFGPLVGLFPMEATLGLARSAFATAQPAASVYSWGGDATAGYPDEDHGLGIAPGAACLWLRNEGDAPDGWRGAIVAGSPCGGAAAPPDSAFTQPAFERTYPGATAADYPRTARWEWDLNASAQFIGMKCGDAWCAVMPAGAGRPRTEPLVADDLPELQVVPGWSDAQWLAVYDSATARARPGPWGSLVAYRGLAKDSVEWAEGIFAAHVTLSGSPGEAGHRRFAEWFYLEPYRGVTLGELILRFPGQYDEAWWQPAPMKRRQAKEMRYAPAQPHQGGTVRWRWQPAGERVWTFCPNGTCAVGP